MRCMNEVDPEMLRLGLEDEAVPEIFVRGERYYKSGRVIKCEADEEFDKVGITIMVSGTVRGSRTYKVTLDINAHDVEIIDYSCNCQYESFCKHIVALGLAYADKCDKSSGINSDSEEDKLRASLVGLNIDPSLLSQDVLAKLLKAQKLSAQPNPEPKQHNWTRKKKVWEMTPKPFSERYEIELSANNGAITHVRLSERIKNSWDYHVAYPQSYKQLLIEEKQLTETEREVLVILHEHDVAKSKETKGYVLDYARLLRTVRSATIPVYYKHDYANRKLLKWHEPTHLRTTFKMEDKEAYYGNYSYKAVACVLPDLVGLHSYVAGPGDDGLVVIARGMVAIHPMPSLLSHIVARAIGHNSYIYNPQGVYEDDSKSRHTGAHTLLNDIELSQLNEIVLASKLNLDCTTDIVDTHMVIKHEPKAVIVLDYDRTKNILLVLPSVDYGGVRLSACDTFFFSNSRGREGSERRNDPAFGDALITRLDLITSSIHTAVVDEELERKLFMLGRRREDLGIKGTGRAIIKGQSKVAQFAETYLPKIQRLGYEIIETRDPLKFGQAEFRAEFDINLQTENDWLAFDLALYCGEERITLADIEAFVVSKDGTVTTKGGRTMRITNPEAIANLVRMLAHFRRGDGERFEGQVYHAPGLDAVAKGSPYYTTRANEGFRTFMNEVGEMAGGRAVKITHVPKHLSKVLRDYQTHGVYWLNFLRRYRFGGILADDMGLGKTIQALAIISMHAKAGRPTLVVAPKTLLYNWQNEARMFAPTLRTLLVAGTQAERETAMRSASKHDLIVTSYPAIQKDIERWEASKIIFNYCVLDETQYIKNPRTKSAHSVKKIKSDYRLALTGTPLENSVEEIWSVFDFLMPGFLGHHAHFQKHFGNPIMKHGDKSILEDLKSKVSCFMLRRTKNEVLKELPPKIEQTMLCDLSDEQNILYQDVLSRVRKDIFDRVGKQGYAASQIHILAGLTKLRQICNHPALVLNKKARGASYPSAKLDSCLEIIEEIRVEKRKVLVFSTFTKMLDIIAEELDIRKIKYAYLSGKTRDRQGAIANFTKDVDTSVFLISTKAGGVGLNLTAADAVIIFDPWWNPSVERQAIDRTHRIGQTHTVNVYRLRTKGTIEDKIASLQNKKQNLFDALVGESKEMFRTLTWSDVRELLS